jgi:hypothetical protein
MRSSYKILASALALFMIVSVAQALTITNRGQVITINTLTDDGPLGSSTVSKDISKYATQEDRLGLFIASYDFATDGGAVGAIDLGSVDLPKGAILLKEAVIEVSTAVLPATSTNALAVGGVTVLATGTTLGSTGIKAGVTTSGITTADDKIALTVSGDAATSGVFTVYLPYILGNAQ